MQLPKYDSLEHLFHVDKERLVFLDNLQELVCLFRLEGNVLYANSVCLRALQYSRRELKALPFTSLLDPTEIPNWRKMIQRLREGAGYQNVTLTMRRKDGTSMKIFGRLNPIPYQTEERVLAVFQDVTPFIASQNERDRLFLSAPDLMGVLSLEGEFKQLNPAFHKILGYSERDLFGQSIFDYIYPGETNSLRETFEALKQCLDLKAQENRFLCKNGSYKWLSWRANASVEERNIYIILRDITEKRMEKSKLERLAFMDDLTGLLNRRGFYIASRELVEVAAREKKGFLVIMADVDNLKKINDQWGHAEGDAALIRCGELLRARLRSSDVLARVGGDEFAASLMIQGPLDLNMLKENMTVFFQQHSFENRSYVLLMSFGFAYAPPGQKTILEDLLHQADLKMYQTKESKGRAPSQSN